MGRKKLQMGPWELEQLNLNKERKGNTNKITFTLKAINDFSLNVLIHRV